MRLPISIIVAVFLSAGCASNPLDITPVSGFDSDLYLGKWYEIARLDHGFERGLSNVSATYSMRDDGGIKVVNRGCKVNKSKWKNAIGKAYLTKGDAIGQLKVSFFGPFYGQYIVFDLDKEAYSFAYISGGSDNYLWLLSRTPEVTDARRADFIKKSKALGYNTDSLIWVEQTNACI